MTTPQRARKKELSRQARAERLRAQRRQQQKKLIVIVTVLALLFVGGGTALNVGGNDSSNNANETTTSTLPAPPKAQPVAAGESVKGDTPCPAADGSAKRTSTFEKAPPMCIDPNKTYTADFDTTEGRIVVKLDTKATPNTTNNFVVLSRYHYYDGSAIVRTNTGIDIIQGGAPSTQTNSDPGPGYTIKDEGAFTQGPNGLTGPYKYVEGDLVMARSSGPDSSGAQYFFGTGPQVSNLDGQGTYLKFGHVSEGLDVLKKIIGLHAPSDEMDPTDGAPSKLVIVNKLTITES